MFTSQTKQNKKLNESAQDMANFLKKLYESKIYDSRPNVLA